MSCAAYELNTYGGTERGGVSCYGATENTTPRTERDARSMNRLKEPHFWLEVCLPYATRKFAYIASITYLY